MASNTVARAVHKTLTGTTVDTVTLTATGIKAVEVSNRSGTTTLYFTTDGTTPVAAADDTEYVLPGESLIVTPQARASTGVVVKVIGNGNGYSVAVVDE